MNYFAECGCPTSGHDTDCRIGTLEADNARIKHCCEEQAKFIQRQGEDIARLRLTIEGLDLFNVLRRHGLYGTPAYRELAERYEAGVARVLERQRLRDEYAISALPIDNEAEKRIDALIASQPAKAKP